MRPCLQKLKRRQRVNSYEALGTDLPLHFEQCGPHGAMCEGPELRPDFCWFYCLVLWGRGHAHGHTHACVCGYMSRGHRVCCQSSSPLMLHLSADEVSVNLDLDRLASVIPRLALHTGSGDSNPCPRACAASTPLTELSSCPFPSCLCEVSSRALLLLSCPPGWDKLRG